MARAHEGEKTGHGGRNIHRSKRPREETSWSSQASQELLRLRFQTLRTLFDDAETVADVHEAWGVVAARLNDMEEVEMELDAVKCSNQLTRLRHQWQESSTAPLHVLMTECFSKTPILSDRRINREIEETIVQDEGPPMRKKMARQQTEVASPSTPATELESQAETPLTTEPTPIPSEAVSPASSTGCQHEVSSEQPVPPSPQPVEQELPSTRQVEVQDVDVEEFPRQDEIMRALGKRSEQLERLAQSHQHLADATQKLLEALLNR
ncbi:hypothetical protein F441_00055 [Phytophthora nicotianae CJ01A1]|uniref:Uncharacterized protein n=2 Tax=Phytophthora nicotianae TaxID=4792 RepID=W2JWH0_PHYNI|nr:hypothetical protein L915_00055 [Phytophthora nicotianae]ETL50745.1 hypothetical protein L916_00054 [Phytophthora nicotianae]ETM03778.1 hypothetical protein L917_00045 [Phytophthora nicotianae]ETP27437.1 hypothetical protein F441_00055 [Phytophthora nicotianae CJ01A1]